MFTPIIGECAVFETIKPTTPAASFVLGAIIWYQKKAIVLLNDKISVFLQKIHTLRYSALTKLVLHPCSEMSQRVKSISDIQNDISRGN